MTDESARVTMRRRFARTAYVFWQLTWGLPQSCLGFIVWCVYVRSPHAVYRGAVVTYWPKRGAVSLGMFLFLPRPAYIASASPVSANELEKSRKLHAHEYGHSIQSLFFGPLYLLLIGIPSLAWAGFPLLSRQWRYGKRDYYSFFTERLADYLATLFPLRD